MEVFCSDPDGIKAANTLIRGEHVKGTHSTVQEVLHAENSPINPLM